MASLRENIAIRISDRCQKRRECFQPLLVYIRKPSLIQIKLINVETIRIEWKYYSKLLRRKSASLHSVCVTI